MQKEAQLSQVSDRDTDLMFISRNNRMDQEETKMDSLREEPAKLHMHQLSYAIDESVIEYSIPSVTKRKNQNIKINIHINNDIINGKCKNPKSKERNRNYHNNGSLQDSDISLTRSHSA